MPQSAPIRPSPSHLANQLFGGSGRQHCGSTRLAIPCALVFCFPTGTVLQCHLSPATDDCESKQRKGVRCSSDGPPSLNSLSLSSTARPAGDFEVGTIQLAGNEGMARQNFGRTWELRAVEASDRPFALLGPGLKLEWQGGRTEARRLLLREQASCLVKFQQPHRGILPSRPYQ